MPYEYNWSSIKVAVPDNPQDLRSEGLYTTHPPQYTDAFLLLIKAVMLFAKVTDINTDYQLSHPSSPRRTDDPYERPGFPELDELVAVDFIRSLPQEYGHCLSCKPHPDYGMILDTDLYFFLSLYKELYGLACFDTPRKFA